MGGGLLLAFLVPFVIADQLGVQRDVFYLLYVAAVLALFAGWMHATGQSPGELLGRRWRLALVLSGLFAVAAVLMVFAAEDGTSHPGGLTFLGALLWRGVVYGAADGLLLTAFPILVVFAAFSTESARGGARRRIGVGVLALMVSLLFTAVYHLGYSDYRSKKVLKPMAGDLIWAPATLVTLNPVAAPIVHASMHVAAVSHSYETDLFLPPH